MKVALTSCGLIYRWHKVAGSDEWRCALRGRILCLNQDSSHLHYRSYDRDSPTLTAPAAEHKEDNNDPALSLVKHYFNLDVNLTDLYAQWSSLDPNFKQKAPRFSGVRILQQDPWEALVCFICSSNNNINRITKMVENLCVNYGPLIGVVDGRAYHDFPSPETLTGSGVEAHLRDLGFGYRAKYVHRTALIIARERERGWLDSLRNPQRSHLPSAQGMNIEGRDGYREAHKQLLELQGVGAKVADCICLMGLGWGEAVPVDTHMWQIAQRDYGFFKPSYSKGQNKTLLPATYIEVGNLFRKMWGQEAGWAHSVLFAADLDLKPSNDKVRQGEKKEVQKPTTVTENVYDEKIPLVSTKMKRRRRASADLLKVKERDETKEKKKIKNHASLENKCVVMPLRRVSARLRGV